MTRADWEKVVKGDKAAFDALAEKEMAGLLEAAKHEVAYFEDVGDFPPRYMTPEELVGAALIQAWDNRAKKPESMEARAWLYAILFDAADKLAARRRDIQKHETLSTDQVIPDDPLVLDPNYDDDESFYEWYQPDEALKWEDVIASRAIAPEELISLCESAPAKLGKLERRAALLHFRLGFSIEQVCRVTHKPVKDIAALLESARGKLRG